MLIHIIFLVDTLAVIKIRRYNDRMSTDTEKNYEIGTSFYSRKNINTEYYTSNTERGLCISIFCIE